MKKRRILKSIYEKVPLQGYIKDRQFFHLKNNKDVEIVNIDHYDHINQKQFVKYNYLKLIKCGFEEQGFEPEIGDYVEDGSGFKEQVVKIFNNGSGISAKTDFGNEILFDEFYKFYSHVKKGTIDD